MWSFFLFLFSLLSYIMGVFFLLNYLYMNLEMELLNYSINVISISIFIDWVSLLFMSVVMWISSMILLYSKSYMSDIKKILQKRFIFLLLMFILSMLMVIFMFKSITGLILGWDGLGLSSYCLVIYYQNYQSLNSGMVTILINRMGDITIIMSLCLMMMENLSSMNIEYMGMLNIFMILLAALTKSAQIPFSSWLLKAMAAPTPVSALVHSSTLVTAGMYIIIRYMDFYYSSMFLSLMFFTGSLTMFMASLLANFENDIKKIIALSTLSQLGLMMTIMSMGYSNLAYFHLLTHAMFKSVLFMCAGTFIHNMKNNQDIRYYGSMFYSLPITSMIFISATFSLCGFPFLSGFYSKDLILEMIYMNKCNWLSFILLNFSMCFTCSYSIRLNKKILFGKINWTPFINMKESMVMNIPMIMLFFQSIFFGYIMMKTFISPSSNYIIVLKWYMKILIIYLMILSILFYKTFKSIYIKLNKFIHKLMKYMMFLDLLYNASMNKFLLTMSGMLDLFIDKIITLYIQLNFKIFIIKISIKYLFNMNNIFYSMMVTIVVFMIMIIIIMITI
nr:NADH dehydrogenase subunit 5 [Megacampsomeris sp. 1 YJY-2023a]